MYCPVQYAMKTIVTRYVSLVVLTETQKQNRRRVGKMPALLMADIQQVYV